MAKSKTKAQASTREIRLSDARPELALGTINALPFPFMFIDSSHTILMGNDAAAAYLKTHPQKIALAKCPRHHADKFCDYCPLDNAIESGHAEETEIYDEIDHRWYASLVFPVPFVSDSGLSVYILNVIDITSRKIAEEKLVEEQKRSAVLVESFIDLILRMLELRDPLIAQHHHAVADLATAIAAEMGLDPFSVEGIRIASLVHDIGKISIPADILARPGRLSDIEFTYIQKHPQLGRDLLSQLSFPWPIAHIVYQLHERLDGTGYPERISGEAIRLEARIIAVAEILDSMTTHKPFRTAFTLEDALKDIDSKKGGKFDPEVVDACLRLFREKGFKFNK